MGPITQEAFSNRWFCEVIVLLSKLLVLARTRPLGGAFELVDVAWLSTFEINISWLVPPLGLLFTLIILHIFHIC